MGDVFGIRGLNRKGKERRDKQIIREYHRVRREKDGRGRQRTSQENEKVSRCPRDRVLNDLAGED